MKAESLNLWCGLGLGLPTDQAAHVSRTTTRCPVLRANAGAELQSLPRGARIKEAFVRRPVVG